MPTASVRPTPIVDQPASDAGTSALQAMLLDRLMPEFDTTRIEHRVIDAPLPVVYDAAIHANLVDAVRRSRLVGGLFALRAALERAAAVARRRKPAATVMPVLRLAEMRQDGDWVRLGANAPSEFAFGAIGRFWGGETAWRQIAADEFTSFGKPGYAKIAASLSLRAYGAQRTLLTYEARTSATDDVARRAFLRYWALASPGAGVVMRSALALIADEVAESESAQ